VIRLGLDASLRASGGVQVLLDSLERELANHPDVAHLVVAGPKPSTASNAVHVGEITAEIAATHALDAVIYPGNSCGRTRKETASILWPLSVAPAEPFALRRLFPGPIGIAKGQALKAKVAFALRRADALIFSSNYARSVLAGVAPAAATTPSTVVLPAPSISSIDWSEPVDSQRYILWVSHGYPTKLAVEAIESYQSFARQRKQRKAEIPRLLMAGSWPMDWYREDAEKVADDGPGSVEFLGNQDQTALRELYENATAYFFTSGSENASSYALLDALGGGVPTVSSSFSSMPEICGDAVLYANPLDYDACGRALEELVADSVLRKELSIRGRAQSQRLPKWTDIGNQVVCFAERIVTP